MKDNVVISTRVRFARNLKDYPYAATLDAASAQEIIDRVANVLGGEYAHIDFTALTPNEARSYMESHKVSHEFVSRRLPHALFEKGDTEIMVCEEDHIRLQVIKQGLCLEDAYREACVTDDIFLEGLRIAYDEEYGFLSHCPTNLGTGMRASVMMFLPALTMTGNLGSVVTNLSKLGYTVRGIYGEGSEAGGYLYQISNNQTMGITEQQTISGLSEIVDRIADLEAQARDKVAQGGVAVSDTLCRALGTLMYARRITSGEFIDLYSKVRLGVCLGMIDDVDTDTLDRLLCQIMPGNLSLLYGRDLSEAERDTVRAEYIQKILKK